MSRMLRRAMFNVVLYMDDGFRIRARPIAPSALVFVLVWSTLSPNVRFLKLPVAGMRANGDRCIRNKWREQGGQELGRAHQPESRSDRLLVVKSQLSTLETSCRLLQPEVFIVDHAATDPASRRMCNCRTALACPARDASPLSVVPPVVNPERSTEQMPLTSFADAGSIS
ncbi:hypothetical protein OH76DRAFT_250883 [Lentinus brumalis]|uniref:Uncharacterized protein n=1 Tax=Lentinus brumalis TaxID=2498619 RepID=A0A371CLL4_9APHY|nr:hypothetical protein OH76DRAFT_250883 [Polyporus brumalis]